MSYPWEINPETGWYYEPGQPNPYGSDTERLPYDPEAPSNYCPDTTPPPPCPY